MSTILNVLWPNIVPAPADCDESFHMITRIHPYSGCFHAQNSNK